MFFVKLKRRYLNLHHVAVVCREHELVEVVTPYEVLRLEGRDAERVLRAVERLAAETAAQLAPPAAGE
jgi:hypothetical protein